MKTHHICGEVTPMPLFKKDQSNEGPPAAPARARGDGSDAASVRSGVSLIGKNVKISGEITGDEDLLIEGKVEGKVNVSQTLTIGAGGQVTAEVHGDTVIVLGRVNGNVSAAQRVILKPSAMVTGNITCAAFIVNEGASFDGNIIMKNLDKKATPPAAAPLLQAKEKEKEIEKDKEKAKNNARNL